MGISLLERVMSSVLQERVDADYRQRKLGAHPTGVNFGPMKTGIRVVVMLAIAAALFSVVYLLRPKPAAEQPTAASTGEISNSPAESAATEPAAALETETNNLPELIPLPFATIVIEAENSVWRTGSDYAGVPPGTQSFGGLDRIFYAIASLSCHRTATHHP